MVRMASVRRSRRGRRVSAARAASVSVVELSVLVVIFVSPEISAAALGRAEAAARGAVRAVGTEPPRADPAALEARVLLGAPAPDTNPLFVSTHGSVPAE